LPCRPKSVILFPDMSIFQKRTPRIILSNGTVIPEGMTVAHYTQSRIAAMKEAKAKRAAVVEKILAKPRKK